MLIHDRAHTAPALHAPWASQLAYAPPAQKITAPTWINMRNEQRTQYLTRAGILKLLSDEEVASVSAAETAERLSDGDEFLDLKHPEHGVRRARNLTRTPMGQVLPRKAVHADTWNKIIDHLTRLESGRLN
jgi:hypothetical protein